MIRTYNITFESLDTNISSIRVNANSIETALSRFYDRMPMLSQIKNIEVINTPYYIQGVYDDGEEAMYCYDSESELFYWASKHYAFDDIDCSFSIIKIMCNEVEVEYAGWAPGMHFIFRNVNTKELVWETWHQEWDH